MKTLTSPEILEKMIKIGKSKSDSNIQKLFILSIIAGAFIAFAAQGSNTAIFNLLSESETYGVGKFLAGSIFATGLIMVLLAGGELFTGNSLMVISLYEKKSTITSILKNWIIVYIGNFLGSILIAILILNSGLLNTGGGMLGAITLKIAIYKVNLGFMEALILGILCNWLVCVAIWIAMATENMVGKILGMFFPIMLFVTSGFEHSIANMYYIAIGILSKNMGYYQLIESNSNGLLNTLNWNNFIFNNIIPVTIGNVIGGVFFVSTLYWLAHKKFK